MLCTEGSKPANSSRAGHRASTLIPDGSRYLSTAPTGDRLTCPLLVSLSGDEPLTCCGARSFEITGGRCSQLIWLSRKSHSLSTRRDENLTPRTSTRSRPTASTSPGRAETGWAARSQPPASPGRSTDAGQPHGVRCTPSPAHAAASGPSSLSPESTSTRGSPRICGGPSVPPRPTRAPSCPPEPWPTTSASSPRERPAAPVVPGGLR
jgi:hypothetical protein